MGEVPRRIPLRNRDGNLKEKTKGFSDTGLGFNIDKAAYERWI
jgi:hypothetical protein